VQRNATSVVQTDKARFERVEAVAEDDLRRGEERVGERGALRVEKDVVAGGLLLLLGSAAVFESRTYGVGTLMQMGPGFMPMLLGVILIVLGMFISASAIPSGEGDTVRFGPWRDWLSWLLIVSGPVAFIILGVYGGLIPATFSCVFISALADRSATWKSALALASIATVVGVFLFGYLLQLPFPWLQWD
jgi:Tripartite tricarboxylate transporter TctB family